MTPATAIAEQSQGKAWHSQSAEEVLAQLASTLEGLASHEAAQRLATNGLNGKHQASGGHDHHR